MSSAMASSSAMSCSMSASANASTPISSNAPRMRGPHRPMSQDRNDPREQEPAEHQLELGVRHQVDDFGDGEPESLPHLFTEEAVAHPVAGVDAELLAFVALALRELR